MTEDPSNMTPEECYDRGLDYDLRDDYAEARWWLEAAAAEGHAAAHAQLSSHYLYGLGVPRDRIKGLALLHKSAELGWTYAYQRLAYQAGYYEQDFARAAALYRKGAEMGCTLAMRGLAYLYETGKGVERDIAEAFRLYRMADAKSPPETIDFEKSAARALKQGDQWDHW